MLSRELHRAGIVPPIDVLPSLSRLMNAGIGEGRTRPEHRAWANQLYALYASGREARLTAAIVGESSLPGDRPRGARVRGRFERDFVGQGRTAARPRRDVRARLVAARGAAARDLVRIDDDALAARRAVVAQREADVVDPPPGEPAPQPAGDDGTPASEPEPDA